MSWTSTQHLRHVGEKHEKYSGYSFPLCAKIVETLEKSNMKFNIQTLHILWNNTRKDSEGHSYPICSGFLVSFELNIPFYGTFWSVFAGEVFCQKRKYEVSCIQILLLKYQKIKLRSILYINNTCLPSILFFRRNSFSICFI